MKRPAILARLQGVQKAGDGWLAFCPGHEDRKKRSLSVGLGRDGRTLLNCHALRCPPEQIARAVGMSLADLGPPFGNGARPTRPREVSAYDYRDETGTVLYQVVRFDPKDFRHRRPDGQGGWTWSVKGIRRVVYRLDELTEQRRVFLCEGEGDVDRLKACGIPATTTPGGASAWRGEYADQIYRAGVDEVIALPDNDDAGRAYVGNAAPALMRRGVDVRVLALPGMPPKGDVSDWLDVGHSAEELLALAATAPPFAAGAPTAGPASVAEQAADGHVAPPPELAQVPTPLRVPERAMLGVGRDFAKLYGEYLETPESFLYFVFLTYFGAVAARRITLRSALATEPRLYTVLLGESADTRKSTALRMGHEFFSSLGARWSVPVLYGVGSAEGLAAELKEHPELLLHSDEFKSFVDKARNENSVVLPMVTTLFERGEYDNRTKQEKVSVRGAALSLLAACTTDTYATMFDERFISIGFLNRLWLVTDRSTPRFSVPLEISSGAIETLRCRVNEMLERIDAVYVRNSLRAVAYDLTPEARAIFDTWYQARTGSMFERRLDTYGHRLMLLLAASLGRHEIDAEVAEAAVALLGYQLDVRRECDPVDADNAIAKLEVRIRRALDRGALKGRDLKRKVNYQRAGIWVYETALENLVRTGEVCRDSKTDTFWLAR